jgi:mono/diheme cytochrome c family protein
MCRKTTFGLLLLALLLAPTALFAADEKKKEGDDKKKPATGGGDAALIAKGKGLFQTKICFTCHQVDPKVPSPAGMALKAPKFIGKFWGTEREVNIGPGGPVKKVKMDAAYFTESIKMPMAKIVKGAIPGMAPLPTTDEEIKALMAYVKSLSDKAGGTGGKTKDADKKEEEKKDK